MFWCDCDSKPFITFWNSREENRLNIDAVLVNIHLARCAFNLSQQSGLATLSRSLSAVIYVAGSCLMKTQRNVSNASLRRHSQNSMLVLTRAFTKFAASVNTHLARSVGESLRPFGLPTLRQRIDDLCAFAKLALRR